VRDNAAVHARFYAPEADGPDALATLTGDEAQHLTRVLRLGVGAAVRLFDGRGHEYEGRIERIARDAVEVRVGVPHPSAPEPGVSVTLAQAALKGDKMDDVVRDAVMIGAAAIQPLVTSRSEVSLATLARAHRRDRWTRIAVASAKQCGRAVVPAIHEAIEFEALPAAISALRLPGPALMLVEPGAVADSVPLGELEPVPPKEVTLVVGPEGGWTAEELARAAGPCRPMTLGGRTIRADAMATVAIAALFARWGEL
jgi:16S rRNA (uracil1498-N3)-methyltransferase